MVTSKFETAEAKQKALDSSLPDSKCRDYSAAPLYLIITHENRDQRDFIKRARKSERAQRGLANFTYDVTIDEALVNASDKLLSASRLFKMTK
jgi:2-phosphoglycerate kinase